MIPNRLINDMQVFASIWPSARDLLAAYGNSSNIMRDSIVVTGCFDLLHRGHVELIRKASNITNFNFLFVGINSDNSVRRLKGANRPLISQDDRAFMLSALKPVDGGWIFDEDTVSSSLEILRPGAWVKGGDWTLETLDPVERKTAESVGTKIILLSRIGDYSTTSLHKKLQEQQHNT